MPKRRVDIAELGRLLDERRMSLRDLQQATKLSWTFVKYVAAGERNPGRRSMSRIAAALGVPVDALTSGSPTAVDRRPVRRAHARVQGYTRKDGVQVRDHTRARPVNGGSSTASAPMTASLGAA